VKDQSPPPMLTDDVVLFIIDRGKMNREALGDYETGRPKWKELRHTVMVNNVKG
jgi:hypothetical protein